jgi:hypothetical protein
MWAYSIEHERIFENIEHAMSRNILGIFVFHLANFRLCGRTFHDMAWNILPHHLHIFWDQQWLLILDMGLANKTFKCNLLWRFEDKRKQKHAFHHPWYNQYSKCLGLLENIYKIFKIVEMGGNYMLEKYFKIFQYLPECVEMAKVLWYYTWDNIHESM